MIGRLNNYSSVTATMWNDEVMTGILQASNTISLRFIDSVSLLCKYIYSLTLWKTELFITEPLGSFRIVDEAIL